jgi:hypothetical protein
MGPSGNECPTADDGVKSACCDDAEDSVVVVEGVNAMALS